MTSPECAECLERLWPENPRVPQWDSRRKGYLRPECYGCPNYPPEEEKEIVYADMQWTRRQWDTVQQLRGQVTYIQRKYEEAQRILGEILKQYDEIQRKRKEYEQRHKQQLQGK